MGKLMTKAQAEAYYEVGDFYDYLDYVYMCGNRTEYKKLFLALTKEDRYGFLMYLSGMEELDSNKGLMAIKVGILDKIE